jgi:hypothetical protein
MCKEASILVMWKPNGPCEAVEGLLAIISVVLIVLYLISFSLPASVVDVSIQLRVHEWLHPDSIKALWFQQVDNSEAVSDIFSGVLNSKIKPLSVFIRIEVRSQGELILIGASVMEKIGHLCNLTHPLKINVGKYCFSLVKIAYATTEKPALSLALSLSGNTGFFQDKASHVLPLEPCLQPHLTHRLAETCGRKFC